MTKPSIVSIVGERVQLRKAGKEYFGLCPFHSEKTPSLSVNEEKGLFHCFGCNESGDVFDFVMAIEKVDFKGALAHLGLSDQSGARPKPQKRAERQAAETIARWSHELSIVIGNKMYDLGQRTHIARKVQEIEGADRDFLSWEAARCQREWELLEVIQDDLFSSDYVTELWRQREALERIVNG